MPVHDWTRIDPNQYHHFHGSWYFALSNVLNGGLLPRGYYALTEQASPPIVPDLLTLQAPESEGATWAELADGVATLPLTQIAASGKSRRPPKRSRRWLAIRHNTDHRLVAVIEIVSPSNKAKWRAFDRFIDKSIAILSQGIHLVVLDLFPSGPRSSRSIHAALWRELVHKKTAPSPDKPFAMASYCSEGGGSFRAFVEPVAVGDVLPNLPLFLTPKRHISLPLDQTYQTAYVGFPEYWKNVLETDPAKK